MFGSARTWNSSLHHRTYQGGFLQPANLEVGSFHSPIHITGFINEATKTELFINALMTCSPSLGEGFGIPVLDAACLGVPTLASSCDSHQEIANLFDFDKYVHLLQLGHYGDWGEVLNFKCKQQLNLLSNPKQEFDRRRARYTSYQAQISSQFEKSLCAAITNAVKS